MVRGKPSASKYKGGGSALGSITKPTTRNSPTRTADIQDDDDIPVANFSG